MRVYDNFQPGDLMYSEYIGVDEAGVWISELLFSKDNTIVFKDLYTTSRARLSSDIRYPLCDILAGGDTTTKNIQIFRCSLEELQDQHPELFI